MLKAPTVPDWLNESFLKTVLKQDRCHDKEVKVNSFDVTPAVPPGANYGSDLFRVQGKYQEEDNSDQVKEVSVLVKVLVTTQYMGKFLEEHGLGEKEYLAYSEFLPEVYKVLPKDEKFTPKLLYSLGPKAIVLEDLKDQGFEMADRLKQLDFNHCLVCMRTVAKFHAASIAVIKNKPEFIEKLGKHPIYDRENAASEMIKNSACMFTKAVKTWDGFEDFEEKSRRVLETIRDDVCDVAVPRKDILNVLNHGDLWLNNMMFKYDSDGNIVDFRLVDFQQSFYGTPVMDLLYFLFSSANQEVRENRLDELFSAYLETLNSVLEQLSCEERLTRDQLEAELKRCQCYVFFIAYTILLAVLTEPVDLAGINMDEMPEDIFKLADSNPFEICFYGKYYTVAAQQIVRYLYKVGFF